MTFTNYSALKYTLKQTLVFLSWVPVLYVINEHVAFVGVVEGLSMKPTLNPESNGAKLDHVVLWKWNCKSIQNLNVNDVVFLRSPINPETVYVKRIKAKQGDLVVPRYPDTRSRVLVPVNHLWVEGDNIHSIDSNTYGPISSGLIIGKAVYIIWPWTRIGPIPTGGRECRESRLSERGG
ncbi:DEKNAAC104359 [Brettanomyces naardenensis]|uniref:Mitochondrial inner membrane protease subunit 2 n=1 Tax=Brettanomyces naardenensis TaxID=13370 RepID=A0A448YQN1_BRENA|nr:DEKNAAC104359 [Brettanomyces naardenensis]